MQSTKQKSKWMNQKSLMVRHLDIQSWKNAKHRRMNVNSWLVLKLTLRTMTLSFIQCSPILHKGKKNTHTWIHHWANFQDTYEREKDSSLTEFWRRNLILCCKSLRAVRGSTAPSWSVISAETNVLRSSWAMNSLQLHIWKKTGPVLLIYGI